MKQIKQTLWIVTAVALVAPIAISAQTNDLRFGVYDSGETEYGEKTTAAGMTENSIGEILVNVMNWLMAILGIGAIISFVIAGILYLVAAGDEGKTEKAKTMMVYAIIALVVALVGYVIVNTVVQLTGSGAGDDSLSY
jgi:uncharacterized membrane protein YjgN (DUF898 family)